MAATSDPRGPRPSRICDADRSLLVTRRSWILMGLLAALWGASYMFIKIALDDGMPAPSIVFVRIVLGAAVLVPIALHRGAFAGPARALVLGVGRRAGAGRRPVPAHHLRRALDPVVARRDPRRLDRDLRRAAEPVAREDRRRQRLGRRRRRRRASSASASCSASTCRGRRRGSSAARWCSSRASATRSPRSGSACSSRASSPSASPPARCSPRRSRRSARRSARRPTRCRRSGTWLALVALGAGGTGIAFLLYYTLIADIGASRAAVVAYMAPGFAVAYGALFLERADHGRDDRRPRAHPHRLVARRRGPPAVAAEVARLRARRDGRGRLRAARGGPRRRRGPRGALSASPRQAAARCSCACCSSRRSRRPARAGVGGRL